MKDCSECKKYLPLDAFPSYSNNRGMKPRCRPCENARVAKRMRVKRANDPAYKLRQQQSSKSYREKYTDGYKQHLIKKRAVSKSIYYSNLFSRLRSIVSSAKVRAVKKGFEFSITAEVLHVMIHCQNFKCNVTGIPFELSEHAEYSKNPYAPSLDRKDSDKGYTLDNIQLVCTWYNMLKNEWSDDDVKYFVAVAHKTFFGD